MIAIMISDKPKWCAKMMNGEKSIEVRKNKALASAIQKLIDKYGYADIYVCCSKGQGLVWDNQGKGLVNSKLFPYDKDDPEHHRLVNGKVPFKFRCYNVGIVEHNILSGWNHFEDCYNTFIERFYSYSDLLKESCLKSNELHNYLKGQTGYAIHISQLEIFDKPKELKHFRKHCGKMFDVYSNCINCKAYEVDWDLGDWCKRSKLTLTKAPQNFCYVEVE